MIEYDDIIKDSPFLINHLITLNKTHDFYINKHIKAKTDILPSQYYMLLFLYKGDKKKERQVHICDTKRYHGAALRLRLGRDAQTYFQL